MTSTASRRRTGGLGIRFSVGAFLMVASALTLLVAGMSYSIRGLIERTAGHQMTDQIKLLVTVINASDNELRDRTEFLARSFQAGLKGQVEVDPTMVDVKGRMAPTLKIDGQPLNLDFTMVDAFTQSTGAVATIFVRSGDEFIRVTTSLKDANAERVVGTTLDHAHPAYAPVMKGAEYTGLATLFGRQYMTHYTPLKDASGKVVALAFVGIDFSEHLASLKQAIRGAKIGATGYFFVLDATPGKHAGDLIVHPALEGKNILDSRDADGRAFISDMLQRKEGLIRYPWINKSLGETQPRDKLVAFELFQNWNWEIAGGMYTEEYTREVRTILATYAGICVAVVLAMSGAFFLLIRRQVTRPLIQATLSAESLAQGDLTVELKSARDDEVGDLVRAMNKIGAGLTTVVRSVVGPAKFKLHAPSRLRARQPPACRGQQWRAAASGCCSPLRS